MRKIVISAILLAALAGCYSRTVEKPVVVQQPQAQAPSAVVVPPSSSTTVVCQPASAC